VPEPDEAMLVSGGKGSGEGPFRVVTGHGAFVIQFFRKARFLSLSMAESEVSELCVTKQGIALEMRAVIAFKGRQRSREHRQRGAAVSVGSVADVGTGRAHLLRTPALDRRLDDGRGDRD